MASMLDSLMGALQSSGGIGEMSSSLLGSLFKQT